MKEFKIIRKGFFRTKIITRDFPVKWSEMNTYQFLAVTKMFNDEMTEDEFIRVFFSLSKKDVASLDDFSMYKLTEQLSCFSSCMEPIDFFFFDRLPGTKLLAPGKRLKGMTFEQFMHVDTHFTRYLQTEGDAELDTFITHLYIAENDCFVLPTSEKKHLFSYHKSKHLLIPSENIKGVRKVDKNIKYAVFFNFILIKNWLAKSFPYLFPEGDDAPVGKQKKKIFSPRWLDIFDSFVGDDIPQMQSYQILPVTTAFRLLNKRIRDAQKRK